VDQDHDKFEAMDILNKYDIPCGPILSMKEIAEEPSLRATGTVVEVDHPASAASTSPSATRSSCPTAPPR
jgi:crotonobetainyl-CoA:carnitine CoA-transferase CaiB-like acyl-CoA transferase